MNDSTSLLGYLANIIEEGESVNKDKAKEM
jgi:hypothetical protein